MIFQSFSGLRGAVGISLAIFLDNVVRSNDTGEFEIQTNKLFGFVGGIAFMTLIINATLAGPLLRHLGLTDTSTIRGRILTKLRALFRSNIVNDLVRLLAQPRFHRVDFGVVRHHVPLIMDINWEELMNSVNAFRQANMHKSKYVDPNLQSIMMYIRGNHDNQEASPLSMTIETDRTTLTGREENSNVPVDADKMSLVELRRTFLEVLRSAYQQQIANGELFDREFVAFALEQSLDFAADAAEDGLHDWEYTSVVELPLVSSIRSLLSQSLIKKIAARIFGERSQVGGEYEAMRTTVEKCLGFMYAHTTAQNYMRREFFGKVLSPEELQLIEESNKELRKAETALQAFPTEDLDVIISHRLSNILLNNAAREVERVNVAGLLKASEAEEFRDSIQELLTKLNSCAMRDHRGEVPDVIVRDGP